MKKILFFICLFVMCFVGIAESCSIYKYIADTGQEFYYYRGYAGNATLEDIKLVKAQGIHILVETNDPNYNAEEIIAKAAAIFEDSLRALYNSNKDYMWEHYPDYKYTYEEFRAITKKLTSRMAFADMCGVKFFVNIDLDLEFALSGCKIYRIEDYPYILGYLYKKVKFNDDGTKCKVQNPKYEGIKLCKDKRM